MTVNTCCLQVFLVFNIFFFIVSEIECLLSLAEFFNPSPSTFIYPIELLKFSLGCKVIAFALCLCGVDKNLKGLSKVTREKVMVFGTFKTI